MRKPHVPQVGDRVSQVVDRVEIVEVSPRDGLQNERHALSTPEKVELIARARKTGVRRVEVTSFVRPDRVPKLADAAEVVAGLAGIDIVASALALNMRGYDRAVGAGIGEINTVVLATDTFSQRNQGMSTADAIAMAGAMCERARGAGVRLTITIGASFGCPFEGEVSDERFAEVLGRVADLGADEIALADTIGVAVPSDIERRFALVHERAPATPTRVHLHDTRNTGIANAVAAVRTGVKALDASLGGIGGCPFAPNATGNIATEDLVYLLDRMGIASGVALGSAIEHARWVTDRLGIPPSGRLVNAGEFPRPVTL
jgi:hydroxymethylglutaryl-CoA lyase